MKWVIVILLTFLYIQPTFAKLSDDMMKHFFKEKENLQYLIWTDWASSYLALSKEHKLFVQDLANLLLTDEYAKNIEENKRNHSRKYQVISKWERKLKTSSLWLLLRTYSNFLRDIEKVRSWVGKSYNNILWKINKYKEKRWFNPNPKLYELLETLKPEVEAVEKVHEFLRKKGLEMEMNNRKKSEAILAEIKRLEWILQRERAKTKELDEIINKQNNKMNEQNNKMNEQNNKMNEQNNKMNEQNNKINELNNYLEKLRRLSELTKKIHR